MNSLDNYLNELQFGTLQGLSNDEKFILALYTSFLSQYRDISKFPIRDELKMHLYETFKKIIDKMTDEELINFNKFYASTQDIEPEDNGLGL
jgi:hypothetical protein